MTIGSGVPYNEHTGNAVTTTFAYGFTLLEEGDLVVTVGGVATSAYTVTGLGDANGGTVVFDTAPASLAAILLQRVIALVRATEYQSNGDLQANTINEDLDRPWMAIQELSAQLGGALRLPYPEQLAALPSVEDLKGHLLGVDAGGSVVPIAGADDASAATLALDLLDDTSAVKAAGQVAFSSDVEYGASKIGAVPFSRNVKQHGALRAGSDAANKTAVQAAITAAQALGKSAVIVIPADIDYGYDSLDSATWPSFTGITVPVVIHDYAPGVVSGANTTGAQHRIWMHTPQTTPTPGLHDGNGQHIFGDWHPYQWVGVNGGIPAVRTANDNLRASYFVGVDNEAALRIGQGTQSSATLTKEELSNVVIEAFPLTGDTITGSNWGLLLGERKRRRASYGGGANNPLAAHDFYPGNGSIGSLTFTAGLAGSATSGTLTSNWAGLTDSYAVAFSNGDLRTATLTNGSAAVTWTGGLSGSATTSASYAAEALDLALFRTPFAATTVSLQSSAGTSSRSFIRNNAGVTEIGAQTGGASIKIRQADSFLELGSGSDYTYHHSVQGSRASNWVSFVNNTSATDGFVQRLQSTSTQSAGWSFLEGYANAGADKRVVIAGTGNITNVNNSYGAISDAKLKQDITDAGSAWDDVKAFRFRKFRFKSDPSGPLQLGVVAQELEEVSPGLVEAVADYAEVHKTREHRRVRELLILDADGKRRTEEYVEVEHYTERNPTGESTLTVKYSVLLLKAAVAMQEAMRRIEALEAKVP